MKKTHKQKIKLARKMRTNQEVIDGVNLFDSEAWINRKESKLKKNLRKKSKPKKEFKAGVMQSADIHNSKL